jgi:hypothetical protein
VKLLRVGKLAIAYEHKESVMKREDLYVDSGRSCKNCGKPLKMINPELAGPPATSWELRDRYCGDCAFCNRCGIPVIPPAGGGYRRWCDQCEGLYFDYKISLDNRDW